MTRLWGELAQHAVGFVEEDDHNLSKKRRGEKSFAPTGCGERGIRTPGGVTLNGFQDRRIRPLCHLSVLRRQKYTFFRYFAEE